MAIHWIVNLNLRRITNDWQICSFIILVTSSLLQLLDDTIEFELEVDGDELEGEGDDGQTTCDLEMKRNN